MEQFEEQLQKDLHQFLHSMKELDERLPEPTVDGLRESQCPDVEKKWEEIAYVTCLHQLYLAGATMQLRRMGYRMTKMN